MNKAPKWGFGMAPLKSETEAKNRKAVLSVKHFVEGTGTFELESLLENISWVKGIFNRVVKQDQWDWFTVNMYLDYPRYSDIRVIVSELATLRNAIKKKDNALGVGSIRRLKNKHFIEYCDNYLNFDIHNETEADYLYILSRREEKDILKIGMTTRNVQKRVNEINSATGVLYPYSARKVFKVINCKKVEKEVHELLSEYRIRPDREFFKIGYKEACTVIEDYLEKIKQYYYSELL